MTLDLAIATHGREGIERVGKMLLPPVEGVRYVVSWQEHHDAPLPESVADREDVSVWRLDVRGVSHNRNNATSHCTADIVLASDDDLIYEPDAFSNIIRAFRENPSLDLATFRVRFPKEKPYPADGSRLTVPFPRGYWVSCVEIAFRRERLSGIRFNPELGPGAPKMLCGEDEMFVIDAVRGGLDCRHIGVTICSHPWESTGSRISEGILLGQGYIIRKIYPVGFIFRIMLKAWRMSKKTGTGSLGLMRCMLRGALGC